jgi:hypothetical protein
VVADATLFFCLDSQIKAIVAIDISGIIARFTEIQPLKTEPPEQFIKPPEAKEATVTLPKTNRSLMP